MIPPPMKAKPRRKLPPELVDVRGAAELLAVSPRHLATLVASGLAPEPLKLGAARRWSVAWLAEWARNGCQPMGAQQNSNGAKPQ